MDTRIWMQESFWESTEEQNGKESPQENAEHLLIINYYMYFCSGWDGILWDQTEFSSVILYSAVHRNPYDIRGITETEAGR